MSLFASHTLPGLTATLDKIVYYHGGASLPAGKQHVFVYFITIRNDSERTITLFGRKWTLEQPDGEQLILEGDKIVGEMPRLTPGEQFSYNSYHVTGMNVRVHGSFHGIDDRGEKIHVALAPFEMRIP